MIIAIESASSDLSVAVADRDGQPLDLVGWSSAPRQGHELLPRLLSLLANNDLRLDRVSAVAVGIGPGSFTGLRVGMSLAKGLAFALRVPLVGVPSLEAWLGVEPDAVAAVVRAGAREAYLLRSGDEEPAFVDREAIAIEGTLVAPRELVESFGLHDARPPLRAAEGVARMAAERLGRDPRGDDLSTLEPSYLRPPRGLAQPAGAIQWR